MTSENNPDRATSGPQHHSETGKIPDHVLEKIQYPQHDPQTMPTSVKLIWLAIIVAGSLWYGSLIIDLR